MSNAEGYTKQQTPSTVPAFGVKAPHLSPVLHSPIPIDGFRFRARAVKT